MTLRDDLLAQPDPKERHRIKAEAFAALPDRSRAVTRGRFRATLTSRPAVDARGALAFTLRIERDGVDVTPPDLNPVRVVNPPILVPDAAGPIVLDLHDREGRVTGSLRYREDLEAALLSIVRELAR